MQETKSPILESIDRVLDETYARGTIRGEDGVEREIYPAGMRAEQGDRIAEVVAREGAKRSFETGFAFGLSTLRIVRSLVENGAETERGPIHFAFDPFQGTDWGYAGRALCTEAGIGDLVRLREERSQIALPAMVGAGERFDLAFIDGSHLFENAFTDVLYALQLVKPGGLVLVDDTWMPSVRSAVDYFVRNMGLEIDAASSDGAEDWRLRRTRFRRREKGGRASMLGLRVPVTPRERAWDHFAPFGDPA